jgi:hypothetical protein
MKNNISKALTEVWEWKELAYEEVKHLPREQAIRKRLESSLKTVHQLGLKMNDKTEGPSIPQVAFKSV